MSTSPKTSYLLLRLGLAMMFLWWGIVMFRQPDLWLTTWLPTGWLGAVSRAELAGLRLIFIGAVFCTLAGLSFLLNIFAKPFALLATLFLLLLLLANGLGAGAIPLVGLLGALLAVLFWPAERVRF